MAVMLRFGLRGRFLSDAEAAVPVAERPAALATAYREYALPGLDDVGRARAAAMLSELENATS